eukprot:5543245-Pleurochrysis_carterae.AAC.1
MFCGHSARAPCLPVSVRSTSNTHRQGCSLSCAATVVHSEERQKSCTKARAPNVEARRCDAPLF